MSAHATSGFEAKLDGILARRDELGHLLASASGEGYATLAREFAELETVAGTIRALRARLAEAAGLEEMLADPALDAEMRALAEGELATLEAGVPEL
ncbi:MAG: prfA, partial [Geminicoccaceae bacterium]|nr:prfA [Geminicoccaceae bacterium]